MQRVIALRGVCIGVERHLVKDETADLEPQLAQYLVSIGAVRRVPDEPVLGPTPDADQEPESKPAPVNTGKKGK